MFTFATRDDLEKAINTPYAWPGGYPMFLFMADCGVLCQACAKENRDLLVAYQRDRDSQWCALGQGINWEDTELTCSNCDKAIESAYGG